MVTTIDKAERLAGVHLFARCNDADLSVLARRSDLRRLPAGRELCREGLVAGTLWVVHDGAVHIGSSDGRDTVLGPGAAVGELALVLDAPHRVTAVTTTDTTVVVLTATEFRSLLWALPQLAERTLAVLATDLLSHPPDGVIH